MNMTFKQFLTERQEPELQKSVKLDITIADHNDDDIYTEVELVVDYQLVEDGQGYDHEKKLYDIDPESIEYIVNEDFSYNGKKYDRGMDLSILYDNVFIDDTYTRKSKSLSSKVSNYFINENLSNDDKEEAFNDLLIIMIEHKG